MRLRACLVLWYRRLTRSLICVFKRMEAPLRVAHLLMPTPTSASGGRAQASRAPQRIQTLRRCGDGWPLMSASAACVMTRVRVCPWGFTCKAARLFNQSQLLPTTATHPSTAPSALTPLHVPLHQIWCLHPPTPLHHPSLTEEEDLSSPLSSGITAQQGSQVT